MDIVFVGTSHRVASVETRGQLALACGHAADLGARLGSSSSISEVLVLATCHRLEVYAAAADSAEARRELESILGSHGQLETKVGVKAVTHLARVACGLESLILGEAEIAGQVRRAADQARAAGTLGPYLERVVAGALRASGRARAETRIAAGAQSAAGAAVALTERTLGALRDRDVLVIGAGQAGRQALDRLAKRRPRGLHIASRSSHHARQAAETSGATIVPLDQLASALLAADAVIAATQSDGYLLTAEMCAVALAERCDRPLLAVDLSVPSVIDPAVSAVPGVTLRTVDDLGDIVRESTARRRKEVPLAEAIALDEARRTSSTLTKGRGQRAEGKSQGRGKQV